MVYHFLELPTGHADFSEIKAATMPSAGDKFKTNRHWFAGTFCIAGGHPQARGGFIALPDKSNF
jgi:hypothetical protein